MLTKVLNSNSLVKTGRGFAKNMKVLKYRYEYLPQLLDKVTVEKEKDSSIVTLVRHAESFGNQDHMIYGYMDFNLTAKGIK